MRRPHATPCCQRQAAAHISTIIKKAKKKRNHPLLGAACKQHLVLGDAGEGNVARNTYRRGFELRTEVNPDNKSAAELAQAALTNLTKTKRILGPVPSDASEPAKLGRGPGRSSKDGPGRGSSGGPGSKTDSAASSAKKPARTAEKLAAELQKAVMRGQKLCLKLCFRCRADRHPIEYNRDRTMGARSRSDSTVAAGHRRIARGSLRLGLLAEDPARRRPSCRLARGPRQVDELEGRRGEVGRRGPHGGADRGKAGEGFRAAAGQNYRAGKARGAGGRARAGGQVRVASG